MMSDLTHQQMGQTVGAKLRAARLAKKFTQSQLAHPDFSVSYVSAIERGQINPSLRALEIFAQRLGLSSTDLLSKETSREADEFFALDRSMQSEEEVELQFLEAQIFIRQGAARQVISSLYNLTSHALSPQQEIRLRYLLGWAYYNMALLHEGESVLAEALKIANGPDGYLSLQILNLLGMVHASMHNYTLGLEYHKRCLAMLEKEQQPQDAFFMAQVYTNIGLHYIRLDRFQDAIQMFQRALSMTEELISLDQLGSMYWDVSRHYAETKDYYNAALYGQKYLQLHLQEYSNSLRREIYHYLGRVMMHGDTQRALTYLDQMLHDAFVLQDKLALSSVTTNMAECFLLQGKVDEAYEHAQKAYELASPSGDTIITAFALIVLGRVDYAQKDYEAGNSNFVAGLEMLERIGAHEDLPNQCVFYAQLLEERGMEHEALKYYKKALRSHRNTE